MSRNCLGNHDNGRANTIALSPDLIIVVEIRFLDDR